MLSAPFGKIFLLFPVLDPLKIILRFPRGRFSHPSILQSFLPSHCLPRYLSSICHSSLLRLPQQRFISRTSAAAFKFLSIFLLYSFFCRFHTRKARDFAFFAKPRAFLFSTVPLFPISQWYLPLPQHCPSFSGVQTASSTG